MHLFISEPWQQSGANNIQKFKVLNILEVVTKPVQTKQTDLNSRFILKFYSPSKG